MFVEFSQLNCFFGMFGFNFDLYKKQKKNQYAIQRKNLPFVSVTAQDKNY